MIERRRSPIHVIGATAVSIGLLGCGLPPEEEPGTPPTEQPEAVEPHKNALILSDAVTKWTNGKVKVCWFCNPNLPGQPPCIDSKDRMNFEAESRLIRNRVLASWSAVAKIDVEGWQVCTEGTENLVQMILNDGNQHAGVSAMGQGRYSVFLGMNRSDVAGGLMPHEWGHILGFPHEMTRRDFQDDATGGCREGDVDGNWLDTPADRQSIMASTFYCQSNANLSNWDAVGAQRAYGRRVGAFRPVTTWWNGGLGDHATVSLDAGVSSVRSSGYKPVYANGWLASNKLPGTVALKRYYHAGRGDHFSTATAAGENSAIAAGYVLQETEGYVFTSPLPGGASNELKTWWSSERADNMITTSPTEESSAMAAGYIPVRTEGYVFKDRPYDLLWLYFGSGRLDYLTAPQESALVTTADSKKDNFVGFDGAVLRYEAPGTVKLRMFYHSGRSDNLMTATSNGATNAINAGYSEIMGNWGFVYPTSQPGTTSMNSYWSKSRTDTFTTISRKSTATNNGYTLTRTEGYGFSL